MTAGAPATPAGGGPDPAAAGPAGPGSEAPGPDGAVPDGPGPHGFPGRPAGQQPDWPDSAALAAVTAELGALPPLVFAGEWDQVQSRLGGAGRRGGVGPP